MSFGLTGSPGIHPAGAQGEDAPALPKQIREPLEKAMLPPCPNRALTPFGQGGSNPSSGGSLRTSPGCSRWDGLSCPGSTSPVKDLAPDPRAGLPVLGKQWAGPAFHGHSLLSLSGQVPGALAAPGKSCAKDQHFPGVLGHWMRSQRCWRAGWWYRMALGLHRVGTHFAAHAWLQGRVR